MSKNCDHTVCRRLYESGANGKGASAIMIINHEVILLGKERWGQYAGKYNFPGGKMEKKNGCIYAEVLRECCEEVKYDLSKEKIIDWFVHNGTAIIVFDIRTGLSRTKLNNKIKSDITNSKLKSYYKEMIHVDLFTAELKRTDTKISKSKPEVSVYVKQVLPIIINRSLLR